MGKSNRLLRMHHDLICVRHIAVDLRHLLSEAVLESERSAPSENQQQAVERNQTDATAS